MQIPGCESTIRKRYGEETTFVQGLGVAQSRNHNFEVWNDEQIISFQAGLDVYAVKCCFKAVFFSQRLAH